MISHWTEPDGQAAIEKMGWPEWEDDAGHLRRLRLMDIDGQAYFFADAVGRHDRPTTCYDRRVAIALFRDHAREWLLSQRRPITIFTDTYDGQARYCASMMGMYGAIASLLDDGTWASSLASCINKFPASFADYDEALISAIIATDKPLETT